MYRLTARETRRLTVKEQIMDKLNNWVIEHRDVETGHDFYIPHGDISPIVLSGYGKYYRVTGFWAVGVPPTILWLELWRTNTAGVVVNATLSPNELMGMDLGLCDEIELHKLLNNQIVSEYFNEYPITEKEKCSTAGK